VLRIPDALSSPEDAADALAVTRYYLFGVGDVDGLLQVIGRAQLCAVWCHARGMACPGMSSHHMAWHGVQCHDT